jgi:hypothetical protein
MWWWEHEANRAELERFKLHGYVLVARNYELMRRAPDASEFTQSYLDLDRENKTVASIAWADPTQFPNRQVFDPQKQEEIGWTSARPHLQWNLRLSDRVLKKAFLEYINQHRNAQNIPGCSTIKGKRNKPPSWIYIECLDMRRNKISGYDTGLASKAEEMAARFLTEFETARDEKDEMVKRLELFGEFCDFPDVLDYKRDKISGTLIEALY